MPGILFPAYQKFYSALSILDKFNKEKSFFDNISSLDGFFSEFRNVTFVLQKSIAHTDYSSIYMTNCEKYLSDCRWFVKKRNETIKEHPFQLVKQVEFTVYSPKSGSIICTQEFTIDEDIELTALIDQLRQLFMKINPIEVFFSAEFSFFEEHSQEDLYDKLISGIQSMAGFLKVMYADIGEHCVLCEQLMERIERFKFPFLPRDMLLVNDYAYYPLKNEFERAERISIILPGQSKIINRMPLSYFMRNVLGEYSDDYFMQFIVMHALLQSTELLKTIMIIFQDNTFELDSFDSDLKTTTYRKINETAMRILNEDINEIYFMQVYVACPASLSLINTISKERRSHAQKEYLSFMKVDRYLNEEECDLEGDKLNNREYIYNQLMKGRSKQLEFGKINMAPIVEAFRQKNL